MTPTPKTTALFSYIVVGALLAMAFFLLAVASVPFATLKPQLEALSLHGHADVFTQGFHQRLVALLYAAAAVPLAAAAVVFFYRRRIAQMAGDARSSLASFFTETVADVADSLRKESRIHLLLLAAVLVLALAVRLAFLFQPMRYDEAYTYTHFASTPIYLTVSNFSSTNNHIFHTLLVQFSSLIFGNQPWALRLPALIAGWLLVPATYVVTRTFFNKHAALMAGAFVASSSPLILFSTNARGYTMMSLFFLILVALAPYCLRSKNAAPWMLFSVVTALGFYTLPTMLYGFGIAAGWLLLMALLSKAGAARLEVVKQVAASSVVGAALTLVLYSPVLLVFGTNMRNPDVLPQSWERVMSGLPRSLLSAWQQWNVAVPGPISVLIAVGFVVALVFHPRVARHRVSLGVATFLWVVPVVLVQRVVPYDRVWIFLLPLYFTLAGAGLTYLWSIATRAVVRNRAEAVGLIGLALGVVLAGNVVFTQSVYYANDTGTLRDGESIAGWLKDHLRAGDIILAVTPADGPLEYYLPKLGLRAADYWYSTQIRGSRVDPGRRLLAVVQDLGPALSAIMNKAGLSPAGISAPVLVQRFRETSIYQMVPATSPD